MYSLIRSELEKLNIDTVSCLRLDECTVSRGYLLERVGIKSGSAVIFAVPYLSKNYTGERNVSAYSVPRDYHLYFAALFEEIIAKLKAKYPNNLFAGFTDHSPINEIEAAARAGLGVIGKNHLLLTEKYSSFVFIGEIITDTSLPSLAGDIEHCIDCGRCQKSCPVDMRMDSCLSALTQKKGELTSDEILTIKSAGCAWGCDKCQTACPYTENAVKKGTVYTNIEFFNSHLTPTLTSEQVESMTKEQFSERAYSWRGKNTILRNLKILEEKEG